jgi:hypothetical protein
MGKEEMKSRLFFCDFWEDAEASDLSPSARYLGAYFWTNSRANLIGLYGMTNPYIVVEAKIKEEAIEKAKGELENLKKVHFFKNWVYLPNAQKLCGYTVEKIHGIAAQKELARIPTDVLEHFRSLGYKIPYQYPTDSPLNQKPEIQIHEQENNRAPKTERGGSEMMSNKETEEMVGWSLKNSG